MAKLSLRAGSTSNIVLVPLATTDGQPAIGVTQVRIIYRRLPSGQTASVAPASIPTLGQYVSGGFAEVDPEKMPGLYEFHLPDAAVAEGAGSVAFLILPLATHVIPAGCEAWAMAGTLTVPGVLTRVEIAGVEAAGVAETLPGLLAAVAITGVQAISQAGTLTSGWSLTGSVTITAQIGLALPTGFGDATWGTAGWGETWSSTLYNG